MVGNSEVAGGWGIPVFTSCYFNRNLVPGLVKGNRAARPRRSLEAFSFRIACSVGKGETDFIPDPISLMPESFSS